MSLNKRITLRKRVYFYYAKYILFTVDHFVSEGASIFYEIKRFESGKRHHHAGGDRPVNIFKIT